MSRTILNLIDQRYHATRLLSWPEERELRIAVLAASGDASQIERALDAVETFHADSTVTVVAPLGWLPAGEGELAARYPGLSHVLAVPPGNVGKALRPDLALLLHPWPGEAREAEAAGRIQKLFAAMAAEKKWILFRNDELWDGQAKARATRRLLNLARPKLLERIEREEIGVLRTQVEPHLARAAAWAGERPCAHERAVTVFERPRYEMFCPECGTGFTPPEHAPAQEELMRIYGAGYALSSRYLGRRGMMAYAEGCIGHVAGYLEALGFDETALAPEGRRVLDYGCGNGRYSRLWRRGWRYLGVDPSEENIAFAQKFFGSKGDGGSEREGKAEFVAGGLEPAELRERGPFNMIFLSHVLEHVPEPLALLRGLRELAAPGGWLYVEVPNALRYTWSRKHRGYLSAEHLWDFGPGYLAALAREAGWLEARVREIENPDCPYLTLLARQEGAEEEARVAAAEAATEMSEAATGVAAVESTGLKNQPGAAEEEA